MKASNAGSSDQFGNSVSVTNDMIVVGAHYEDSMQSMVSQGDIASNDNNVGDSGAAYVFARSASSWVQQAVLKAPYPGSSDYFGETVSAWGDTIVVGAYYEDSDQNTITNGPLASSSNDMSNSGAAYAFISGGADLC